MEATELRENEANELRAKLEAAVEEAKAVCKRLNEKIAESEKATDKAIGVHPYEATGIAFGLGLLIGMLATWCRND